MFDESISNGSIWSGETDMTDWLQLDAFVNQSHRSCFYCFYTFCGELEPTSQVISYVWQVEAMEMLTTYTSDCVFMSQTLQCSMDGALDRSQYWFGVERSRGGKGYTRGWGGRKKTSDSTVLTGSPHIRLEQTTFIGRVLCFVSAIF